MITWLSFLFRRKQPTVPEISSKELRPEDMPETVVIKLAQLKSAENEPRARPVYLCSDRFGKPLGLRLTLEQAKDSWRFAAKTELHFTEDADVQGLVYVIVKGELVQKGNVIGPRIVQVGTIRRLTLLNYVDRLSYVDRLFPEHAQQTGTAERQAEGISPAKRNTDRRPFPVEEWTYEDIIRQEG